MPYKSQAQEGLFHSKNSPVSKAVVKEFDAATKGKHLPQHLAMGGHVFKVSEADDHFHFQPRGEGKAFRVAKQGLSKTTHAAYQKLCGGGEAEPVQKLDDGGPVQPQPDPNDSSTVPTPQPTASSFSATSGMQDQGGGVFMSPKGYVDAQAQPLSVDEGDRRIAAAKAGAQGPLFDDAGNFIGGSMGPAPAAAKPADTRSKDTAAALAGAQPAGMSDEQQMAALKIDPMQIPAAPVVHANTAGFAQEQTGNDALAAAEGQLGTQRAGVDAAARTAAEAANQAAVASNKTISDSLEKQKQDYINDKINPNDYWEKKSTGGKIASILGILVSGYGQGRSAAAGMNTGNMAMQVIQKQIDENIDAQKHNREAMKSGIQMTQQQLGEQRADQARQAAHAYNMVQLQLQELSDRSTDPIVKARAQQLDGQLQERKGASVAAAATENAKLQYQQKMMQAQQNQAAQATTNERIVDHLGASPQGLTAQALPLLNKDQKERALLVPDENGKSRIYMATDAKSKETAKASLDVIAQLNNDADRLQELREKHRGTGGFITPFSAWTDGDRNEAKLLHTRLADRMAKQDVGRVNKDLLANFAEQTPDNNISDAAFSGAMRAVKGSTQRDKRSLLQSTTGAVIPESAWEVEQKQDK